MSSRAASAESDAAVTAGRPLATMIESVGGDAHDFARVARGDAGDVRAVRIQLSPVGEASNIRVVVCEGELSDT